MTLATYPSAPPSRELLMLEFRALWELGAFFASYPMLRFGPRGDGHPVLVLPGLGASDASTRALRTLLADRGYSAHGWGLGANHGARPGVEDRLHQRLAELAEIHGRKVSLVGWSLGGIMARETARRAPHRVRCVITLGSPFAGEPEASHAWPLYQRLSGRSAENREYRECMRRPPPVPATAIYSRSDGIVAWQGCLEQDGPMSENIEVDGSHCGLGHNPLALHAVIDRLAQPEGRWQPFERRGARAWLYGDPNRGGRAQADDRPKPAAASQARRA
jgi:pimeloyl-ACP methyl ester carboxylesterase